MKSFTDWLRLAAPFLIVLVTLVFGSVTNSGDAWFGTKIVSVLTGFHVSQPESHVPDLLAVAKHAGEPEAVCVRALTTVLGLYLLLPDSVQGLGPGLALLFASIAAIYFSRRVKPGNAYRRTDKSSGTKVEVEVLGRIVTHAMVYSIAMVLIGLAAATIKFFVFT